MNTLGRRAMRQRMVEVTIAKCDRRKYLRDLDDQARLDKLRIKVDAQEWQRLPEDERKRIEDAVAVDFARHRLPKTPSYQRGGPVFLAECYRRMRAMLAERADRDGEV